MGDSFAATKSRSAEPCPQVCRQEIDTAGLYQRVWWMRDQYVVQFMEFRQSEHYLGELFYYLHYQMNWLFLQICVEPVPCVGLLTHYWMFFLFRGNLCRIYCVHSKKVLWSNRLTLIFFWVDSTGQTQFYQYLVHGYGTLQKLIHILILRSCHPSALVVNYG